MTATPWSKRQALKVAGITAALPLVGFLLIAAVLSLFGAEEWANAPAVPAGMNEMDGPAPPPLVRRRHVCSQLPHGQGQLASDFPAPPPSPATADVPSTNNQGDASSVAACPIIPSAMEWSSTESNSVGTLAPSDPVTQQEETKSRISAEEHCHLPPDDSEWLETGDDVLEMPSAFPTKSTDTTWTDLKNSSPEHVQNPAAFPPLQPDDAATLLPSNTPENHGLPLTLAPEEDVEPAAGQGSVTPLAVDTSAPVSNLRPKRGAGVVKLAVRPGQAAPNQTHMSPQAAAGMLVPSGHGRDSQDHQRELPPIRHRVRWSERTGPVLPTAAETPAMPNLAPPESDVPETPASPDVPGEEPTNFPDLTPSLLPEDPVDPVPPADPSDPFRDDSQLPASPPSIPGNELQEPARLQDGPGEQASDNELDAGDGAPESLGEAPEETTTPRQFLRQDSILLDPGEYQIDITFQYLIDETDFTLVQSENGLVQIGEARRRQRLMLLPVEFRLGITPVLQAFVNVPFGWANSELAVFGRDEYSNVGGIGDISIGFTKQFIDGDEHFPDVLGSFAFSIPSGRSNLVTSLSTPGSSLGQGYWTVTGALNMIHTHDPVVIFYGGGYRHRFENTFNNGITVDPGKIIFYRLGVGVAINSRVTFSAEFNGSYITEDVIEGTRAPGSIREPMQLRFATTISKDKKFQRHHRPVKTVEPFVIFGLTEEAIDSMIGISWTR